MNEFCEYLAPSMDDARKVLLRDFLLGASGVWILYQFAFFGVPFDISLTHLLTAGVVASGCGWFQYLSEHQAFPPRFYDVRDYLRSHPLQTVLFTAIGIVTLCLPLMLNSALVGLYYAGFTGMYLGFLGYRFVFGVVRPVPEEALNRM
ncbi:hypothetical protein KU306_16015 (plasmid) [Haloferax larsenii]|uniref:Uncharacterized protein n=2 Tax=Haloferax larsenii TaxID=302484 RepID=A0ABY5RL29_HALLR|nr:hypothetical protein KU306_16015 [Haloferax larsenii]